MNAHELARRLLAGPDWPVYVRGYEGVVLAVVLAVASTAAVAVGLVAWVVLRVTS